MAYLSLESGEWRQTVQLYLTDKADSTAKMVSFLFILADWVYVKEIPDQVSWGWKKEQLILGNLSVPLL